MMVLTVVDESPARRPGDVLEIDAEWTLDAAPSVCESRLIWYTEGRAVPEVHVVETQEARPTERGTHRFQFTLPEWPYSYSGKLFSIRWAVEVVLDDEDARWEFTLRPD